ncbi:hypothetical protein LZ554_005096 [Drepanopeziza brunnea f. sp. 'monogermtubi']|nr:hypothetical protein LZ554_005096 [Drepanopeziza brunnea f. sp. 'monogermtubi']
MSSGEIVAGLVSQPEIEGYPDPVVPLKEDGAIAQILIPLDGICLARADLINAKPINIVEEARWQSIARISLEVQTHPKSFAPYNHHIEDLNSFKDELMAAKKCSEATTPTYTNVEVLLLTWEESDMTEEIEEETQALASLFGVTEVAIPTTNRCQNVLQFRILEFLIQHHDDPSGEILVIVYYTGHGSIRNHSCYWHPTAWAASPSDRNDRHSRQDRPTVDWAKIQENFEKVEQTSSACGSEQVTPASEEASTHRLVDCIRRMMKAEPLFHVAWLYESMISVCIAKLTLPPCRTEPESVHICLSSLAEKTKTESEGGHRHESPGGRTSGTSLSSGSACGSRHAIIELALQYKVLLPVGQAEGRANILPATKPRTGALPAIHSQRDSSKASRMYVTVQSIAVFPPKVDASSAPS